MARRVLMAEVRGKRVRGRQKVALGYKGTRRLDRSTGT